MPAHERKETAPDPDDGGIKGLLKDVGREILEDDVPGQAAKLAYYAFLAMPPALMAIFALAGFIGDEEIAQWLQEQAQVAMPEEVSETIINPFIEEVVLQQAPGPFSIGLVLAIVAASAVFAGLMDSLNHVYEIDETRSFVKKRALAVGVMASSVVAFLLSAAALLFGPEIAEAVGLGQTGQLVWSFLYWPLAFAFVVIAFWVAYYVLPNRDQSAEKTVLLKAASISALLWVIATALFRVYIANFSSYTQTYGFIGAFIILLLWLYVTALVVLIGGELASEMERRA